ncbi:MAG: succinate dehydrogenase iron-sulfur subunit [Pseudomonadota bacterium]
MEEIIIKVFRFDPDVDKKHHFDKFVVPYERGMTVLDCLLYIQSHLDGSLAFRYSCREGVCGSCAMHINGKYQLACEAQVSELKSKSITVRPLAHLPIVRDLFVDLEPFWEKYKLIKPYLIPGKPSVDGKERLQKVEDRSKLDQIVDCILCGCCFSSCMLTKTDPNYIGPAALAKADRFVLDSRDSATEERLAIIGGDDGVFKCHTMFNCLEVCPKDVNPTKRIADLKNKLVCSKYKLGT